VQDLTLVVNHSLNRYLVTGFTNTLHIGSHKQHEPSIRFPKVAEQVSNFLPNWEMLTQDQWVLQTMAGLPTRLNKHSIPDPHATSNPNHSRECILNSSRSCRTAVQRASCRDSALSIQLCVPDIPNGEEGWGLEANNQSEGP